MHWPVRPGIALGVLAATFAPAVAFSERTLGQAVRRQFPAVSAKLGGSAEFEAASVATGRGSVFGLKPRPAEPLPPSGLGPEERAAWVAMVQRGDGTAFEPLLPVTFTEPFVVRAAGLRVVLRARRARASRAAVVNGEIAYENAYGDTDVLYTAAPGRAEEFLVVRSASAPKRFDYELVELSGVATVFLHEGTVRFTDERGRGLMVEKPWVIDAAGRESDTAAWWELGPGRAYGSRRLTLHLRTDGLTYPLLVDPTWTTTGSMATAREGATATPLQNGKVLVAAGAPVTQKTAELYDAATGTWTPTGSLNVGRAEHTATLLGNGKVLVVGGFVLVSRPTASCELYDPATGTWSFTGSLNIAREGHTATLLADGRVLVAGGDDSTNPLASAEIYDPATGTWSPTGTLNSPRRLFTATRLADGRVLAAAGSNPVVVKTAEIYDPSTGLWTPTGTLNNIRYFHTATLLPLGEVLVAGGLSGSTTAETYDPSTGTWTSTGPLNFSRGEHTAALLPNGKLLIAGGSDFGPGFRLTAEMYDPISRTWSPTASLATGRVRHATTLLPDGRVLVAGGVGSLASAEVFDWAVGSFASTASMSAVRAGFTATLLPNGRVLVVADGTPDAEVYEPASGTWTATGPMTNRRHFHTATLLRSGKVLVAGGAAGGPVFKTAELYDPGTNTWSPTAPMAAARETHTATLLECGRVLVSGGYDFTNNLASAEIYDPLTGTWAPTGSLNVGRREHTATLLLDGRVLVFGGWGGSELRSAELYDPATATWAPSGSTIQPRRFHTATLLPNGRVLAVAGSSSPGTTEIFNPATGLWAATGNLNDARELHTATLLPGGRVLVAGGFNGSSTFRTNELFDPASGSWTRTGDLVEHRFWHAAALLPDGRVLLAGGAGLASAEIFDPGLGYNGSWQPVLSTVTNPVVQGFPLSAAGSRFRGISEASGGGNESQNSSTDYPLVQLRRLDNEAVRWLPVNPASGWSDTSFDSTPLGGIQPGPALATVFTNGIPSTSRTLTVECPAPTIVTSPSPQSVCQGGTAVFSVAATGACPTYEWQRNSTSLVEGGRFSGTRAAMLTVGPAEVTDAGDYDAVVALACSSTAATSSKASLTVTPSLSSVSISVSGLTTVCTSCTGGTATESHTGGGAVNYQWGYRTISGGTITDIPGETAASYIVKGADLAGPGLFYLVLTVTPQCGVPLVSNEVPIDVTTSSASDGVQFFTLRSTDQRNYLEWLNPSAPYLQTILRFNESTLGTADCTFPTAPTGPGSGSGGFAQAGLPDAHDFLEHFPLDNDTAYCYTAFVEKTPGVYSAGRPIRGRPFSTAGPVKWAFSAGMTTSLAPPGIGVGAIHAVANDNTLHSMVKGLSGGIWPPSWRPQAMNGPSQGRPSTVPALVMTASRVVFLGSQDTNVYALDADTGQKLWNTPLLGMVQAAPSGMFRVFGGAYDYILVGSRSSTLDNRFYALDVGTGGIAWSTGGDSFGRIGIVSGQAAVDYANRRVYFASYARGAAPDDKTVWCVSLETASVLWAQPHGNIAGAVSLRGDRLYVGTNAGEVRALKTSDGTLAWSFPTGDGPVKGFVMVDRFTDDVYFSTTNKVWSVSDTVGGPVENWPGGRSLSSPSTPVHTPGNLYVYVGAGDGSLHRLLSADGTTSLSFPLGDASAAVGSPTLDTREGFLYVGTDAGIVYAVLPP